MKHMLPVHGLWDLLATVPERVEAMTGTTEATRRLQRQYRATALPERSIIRPVRATGAPIP